MLIIFSMSDMFFEFISIFDDTSWYFCLFLLGMFTPAYRKIFYWGMVGTILSLLFNATLKSIFKVPLFPHLGPGYAFPSGHVEQATFIYTWLAKFRIFNFHKFFFILIPLLAVKNVQLHYHAPLDVIGGMIAGAIFFGFYYFLYTLAISLRIKTILSLWVLMSLIAYNYFLSKNTLILNWCLLPISLVPLTYFKLSNKD